MDRKVRAESFFEAFLGGVSIQTQEMSNLELSLFCFPLGSILPGKTDGKLKYRRDVLKSVDRQNPLLKGQS